MTDCISGRDGRSLLSDSLAPARRRQVVAHVDGCLDCQRSLESLTNDNAGLSPRRFNPDVAAAPVGLQDLVTRLREQPPVESDVLVDADPHRCRPISDFSKISERYELLEQIGGGATSDLYRARDRSSNRIVAIKLMRGFGEDEQSARARFEREAEVAASLSDDRIVTIHHVGFLDGGTPFLVMEHIEGCAVSKWLAVDAEHSWHERVDVIRQVALGLQVAHDAGVVHRDIKPSNVMYNPSTRSVKITDFGLARSMHQAGRLTHDGVIAGTPAYMSPEQVRSPEAVDQRADVYSLAAMMYESLSGQTPFEGPVSRLIHQALYDEPIPLRKRDESVPVELESICMKGLSRSPATRYQSCAEFAADLTRWLDGLPVQTRPAPLPWRVTRWCRRNPLVSTSTICMLCVLAGVTMAGVDSAWSPAVALAQPVGENLARAAERDRDKALEAAQSLLVEIQQEIQQELDQEEADVDGVRKSLRRVLRSIDAGERRAMPQPSDGFRDAR